MLIQYVINSSKYGRVAMYCLNNIFLEELYSISIYLASSQRKYIGTIERKCLDKEKKFNSIPRRIGLEHGNSHCFIVLGHLYGCRDVL